MIVKFNRKLKRLDGIYFYTLQVTVQQTLLGILLMKIQFLKTLTVDVYKLNMDDYWSKEFNKWDEVQVDNIDYNNKYVNADLPNGDLLLDIPISTIKIIK
jgi:hypothetical protein